MCIYMNIDINYIKIKGRETVYIKAAYFHTCRTFFTKTLILTQSSNFKSYDLKK